MDHYDRPAYCPKCGVTCNLEVTISQERRNTCPQCNLVFFDASEQFKGVFYGLFYESGDPGSPPFAMFREEDDVNQYLRFLTESEDDDAVATARQSTVMKCCVYGIYQNSSDHDPWDGKFQDFIPDDCPADMVEARELSVPDDPTPAYADDMSNLVMEEKFRLGGRVPAYFCARTARWYVFFLNTNIQCADYVSINDGPSNFMHTYLRGTTDCLRTNHQIRFLTWQEFVDEGGRVKIPK